MSGWHYCAKKVESDFEEYEYTVVEAYPGLESEKPGIIPHTDAIRFFAESPAELARWLRIAADDVEKHSVIDKYGD